MNVVVLPPIIIVAEEVAAVAAAPFNNIVPLGLVVELQLNGNPVIVKVPTGELTLDTDIKT